jgi:pseudoazurin
MKIRVPNSAFVSALIVAFALTACSNDDAPDSGDPKPPAEMSQTVTSEDGSGMHEMPQSPAPAVTTAPNAEPAPAPEPAPEPVVAEPTPETADPMPAAAPTQHIVKGVVTQWAPLVLFVKPGDQIVFRQMAGHDSETIEGMIPEGAATWKSKLGQEGFAVSPDVPGIYMYKCNPHVSLGMIGAIAVGDPPYANLDAIEAHPQNKGMIGRAIRKLKQALESHDGA